jgi:HSP20 family molecular chaperone IbpA
MDHLFDDFTGSLFGRSLFDPMPFRRTEAAFRTMPAVDVAETDKAYEIKAELPGLDEKNIEVKVANGVLSIRGEKQEEKEEKEKEEKEKDYYRRERSFGSFARSFQLPDGCRARQNRGNVQKWRSVGDAAQERGSTAAGQENRSESRPTTLASSDLDEVVLLT